MVFKWKPDVNIEGKVPGISKFRVGCRQLSLGWLFCHRRRKYCISFYKDCYFISIFAT